nr:hypothetical protein BaRGS_002548 [Batillaria attramentaria]
MLLKEKELLKALETPEEKRARRLAKKEAKERKRKEQMGWDQEYMIKIYSRESQGYTNVDNPFGDEHLLDTFVWSKKIEKEGNKHLTTEEIQKLQKLKMRENKIELEKVKKRRLEREKEREERENERDMMMREKELEYFREWEKQEDSFHLNQAKLRSEIRIKDGRAKPIDLLAKYISAEDDALAVEMHEPYTYLYGLTITDLEDLLEDIRVYLELEEGKNADYWRDIITVTEDELQKLRKLDAANKGKDFILLILGNNFTSGFVIAKGTYYMYYMLAEGDDEAVITEADLEEAEQAEEVDKEEAEYLKGGYSPRLLQPGDLDIDTVIYGEEEDAKKLVLARKQVFTIGRVRMDRETEFEKKAREGMNDDEAQFSVEMTLEPQAFVWSDKYRPRKPRFFNRVHTGFEWNKYNQTHYDIDNPPPKIVQGYKFNIFYPDLIDKTKTPEYSVTPLEDNKDFAVLRFRAGPPYEDIAFKIVSREWEYSYKRGFRCQFQNNIFQLWFHFKRYRYRR